MSRPKSGGRRRDHDESLGPGDGRSLESSSTGWVAGKRLTLAEVQELLAAGIHPGTVEEIVHGVLDRPC